MSNITDLITSTASKAIGKVVGGYSSLGFSLNQSAANMIYSASVNAGLPFLYQQLFKQNISGTMDSIGCPGDATRLDVRHKVSVISRSAGKIIQCPIQENISIKVASKWEPFIPTNFVSDAVEKVAQLTGRTATQRFFSRRIWSGTDPLTFTIPMRFVAVKDALQDVVIPVQTLLGIASPRNATLAYQANLSANGKTISSPNFQVLAPPGPTPYQEVGSLNNMAEQINIYFGLIAKFANVIVSEATVEFDSRVDVNGKPMGAKVDVVFQTYEMYTSENIATAFNIQEAPTISQVAAG